MPQAKSKNKSVQATAETVAPRRKSRAFLVSLLITFGVLLLASFSIVRWTETQILDADGWVAIVSPLPKNEQIATAIGTHAVTQLFDKVDVEQKISEALPERAAFLASPLSRQLQTQANNLARDFVMSDQFQNIWTTANRQANTRLVNAARGQESEKLPIVQKAETKFNLDLSGLRSNIVNRLGQNDSGLFSDGTNKLRDNNIVVGLKTRFENFKRFVNTTDFLNTILPYAIIASFAGAIAIALSRQRAILWIGVSTMIVSTLQVIGLNALRPQIINMVQDNLYRPAAQAIWDALIDPFNAMVRTAFLIGLTILALAIVFGPYKWATKLRTKLRLDQIGKSKAHDYAISARLWTEKNKRYIWSGGGVLLLIFLTFYPSISWMITAKAILTTLIFVSLVELFAYRSYLIKK